LIHLVCERNRLEERVHLLLRGRYRLVTALIKLLKIFAVDELAARLGLLLVEEGLLLVVAAVVKHQRLSQFFSDSNAHHLVFSQVSKRAESLVPLEQRLQDLLGTNCSDWVEGDVHSVQDWVLSEQFAQLACENVIKEVAVQVQSGQG